jgi:hypothetical protein
MVQNATRALQSQAAAVKNGERIYLLLIGGKCSRPNARFRLGLQSSPGHRGPRVCGQRPRGPWSRLHEAEDVFDEGVVGCCVPTR